LAASSSIGKSAHWPVNRVTGRAIRRPPAAPLAVPPSGRAGFARASV
jgi:hypothetical protein